MLKMHRLVTWEAISEPISLDSWQMKQLWPNKGEQSDCFLCCLFAVGQSVRLKMSQNGILGEENWVDISYCIYCEAILKGLAAQSKAKKYKIHWINLGAIQHRVTLTYEDTCGHVYPILWHWGGKTVKLWAAQYMEVNRHPWYDK